MIPRSVKSPTVPIPFHKLLKVVAVVDGPNAQIKQLLDHIAAANFQVEVSETFERDVSEDASVGAYIALVDGERLERARKMAAAVRAIGFRTPLWALADSHRISDIAVVGGLGEIEGYIYLGQQTPAFYAKQVVASV
jgi:ornithine decarboxylase